VIGYYVHHVGAGHLHRARAVALRAEGTVTGLSSLPAPADWPGPWVRLVRDDSAPEAVDPTARGNLHWVPERDDGLCRRMAALSSWIETARPDVLVSDVSAEVALLARLHGVPVVSVVLPGRRGDRAHRNAYAVSSGLVAAWPREAVGMVQGLAQADARRLHHVGALSRWETAGRDRRDPSRRRVLVLSGRGGGHPTETQLRAAAADAPDWSWTVRGGSGEWRDDPSLEIDASAVVVIQAGESAVADVAARRRPAVVVPAPRPFDEQRATGRALAAGPWPCHVEESFPVTGWAERLAEVAALDGQAWADWCDGRAADRLAEYLDAFSSRRRRGIA
jgi:hypothetical protein